MGDNEMKITNLFLKKNILNILLYGTFLISLLFYHIVSEYSSL